MKNNLQKNKPMFIDQFRESHHPLLPGNRKKTKGPKIEKNGIRFDSRLELFMYNLLTKAGIRFEFKKTYTLTPQFRYWGQVVQPITCTIDFWLPELDILIDTTNLHRQQNDLKIKLLKKMLYDNDLAPRIETPKNRTECRALVNELV